MVPFTSKSRPGHAGVTGRGPGRATPAFRVFGLALALLATTPCLPSFATPQDPAPTVVERRAAARTARQAARSEAAATRSAQRETQGDLRQDRREAARESASERREEAQVGASSRRAARRAHWQSRLDQARRNLEEWYQRRLVRVTEIRNIAASRQDADAVSRVDRLEDRVKEIYTRRSATLDGAAARLRG